MLNNGERIQANRLQRRGTLRLTFQYEGEQVKLADQEQLEKIPPATVGTRPILGKNSGFWLEVRDSEGRILFYKTLYNPIQYSVEVKSRDRRLSRIFGTAGRGIFEVQVPDIPEASTIVLFSSPLNFEQSFQPAQELARFPLRSASQT